MTKSATIGSMKLYSKSGDSDYGYVAYTVTSSGKVYTAKVKYDDGSVESVSDAQASDPYAADTTNYTVKGAS